MKQIPYGHQDIDDCDVAAVVAALRSDWLTQGPTVPVFEKAVSGLCQATHALAVSNATSALHLACRALGVGPGDSVWTSPNTFVASANCALYCGATVDFVDIDRATLNMSPAALELKLKSAAHSGRLPRAIIAVHFAGHPCDLEPIAQLSKQYGVRIIEDASHALGATYHGRPIGCGYWSDITVFSFHPVKIATTGEGGMAVTNDRELFESMSLLRSHGITRDPADMTKVDGPWYYEQTELGFNYRMTDIQAALGASQVTRLSAFVARRRALAARYDELLRGTPVVRPSSSPDAESSWHLYVVQVPADERRRVFDELRSAGIGVNVHYIPVHLQPYYRRLGFAEGDFPNAEAYYYGAITLPLFYGLTDSEQAFITDAVSASVRATSLA